MCRTHSRSAHLFHFCPLLLPHTLSLSCFPFCCSQFSHYCSFILLIIVNVLLLSFCFKICITSSQIRPCPSNSKPKCHHSSPIVSQNPEISPNSQQMCQTRLQLNTLIPNRRNSNQMSLKLVPIANEMSSHALYFLKRVSNHPSQLQLVANDSNASTCLNLVSIHAHNVPTPHHE